MRRSHCLTGLAALALGGSACAETAAEIRFITCPIYRDTNFGKKTGCWLADDRETGLRYDVSGATSKPDWHYAVLVEGRVGKDGGNPCGGTVLNPARTSILYDMPCTPHMLPAEGFAGFKWGLPRRNVRPLSEVRPVATGPFEARTFSLYFDWDQDFLLYQYDDYLLDHAYYWLRDARPRQIVVTGYADRRGDTISGKAMTESATIAEERARRVTLALTRLGIDPAIITTRWSDDAPQSDDPEADGLIGQARRRVDIAAGF